MSDSFVAFQTVGPALVAKLEREKFGEYEAPVVQRELESHAANTQWRVVIDLSDVRLVASAGLGAFVNLNSTCKKKGGKFALCNLDENLREVFELTRLHKLLTIAKDREAAVKAVS